MSLLPLPQTIEELKVWLPKAIKATKPGISDQAASNFADVVMSVVHSDYSAKTLAEGFYAGMTDTVDPERLKASNKSMGIDK